MTFRRNTPWIIYKETGELTCRRCGACILPPAGSSFAQIEITGDRFQQKHKLCKVAAAPVRT